MVPKYLNNTLKLIIKITFYFKNKQRTLYFTNDTQYNYYKLRVLKVEQLISGNTL